MNHTEGSQHDASNQLSKCPTGILGFDEITNGVYGFNKSTINICYIGGVENLGTKEKPKWKGKERLNI